MLVGNRSHHGPGQGKEERHRETGFYFFFFFYLDYVGKGMLKGAFTLGEKHEVSLGQYQVRP